MQLNFYRLKPIYWKNNVQKKIEAKINSWNKVMQNLAFEFISDEKLLKTELNLSTDSIFKKKTELSNRGINNAISICVINVRKTNHVNQLA